MNHIKRREYLQNFYKTNDLDNWFENLYVNEKMSSFEISEKIFKETSIAFNARSIQRILKKKNLTREQKVSFKMAIEKGRVVWALQEHRDKVKRKDIPYSIRFRILARANYICETCGNPERLTVDHKVSLSNGGTNDESNLQAICWSCNVGKRNAFKENRLGGGFINPN